MKTKKSYRLLSALLAILMVFAICPMFALSAADAEPTAQAETITYWDGTVPGVVDGAEVTDILAGQSVLDYVIAGTTYQVSLAQFEAHITRASSSLTALDEIGFAMLVIMSNNNFEILENDLSTVNFNGARSTSTSSADGFDKLLGNTAWTPAKATIALARDLYLNDPGTDPATWNEIAPLYLRPTNVYPWSAGNHGVVFDGNGYAITGWNVNHTMTSENSYYNAYGLFGSFRSGALTIKNVAMLDMVVNITVDSTVAQYANTIHVGGLVGGVEGRVDNGKYLKVSNVVVDMDVDLSLSSVATGAYWVDGVTYHAFVGGIVADGSRAAHRQNATTGGNVQGSSLELLEVTNALIMLNANATASKNTGFGGIAYCMPSTSTNLTNVVAVSNATNFKTSFGTFRTGTVTSATNVWATGELNANLTDASNKVVTVDNIKSDSFWAENGATMADAMTKLYYPVPTTLATNEALINYMNEKIKADMDAIFGVNAKASAAVEIDTADKLVWASQIVNANKYTWAKIKLTANIDMTGRTDFVPFWCLYSVDGQGYVISNLTVSVTPTASGHYGGFTHHVGSSPDWSWDPSGSIKNIAFTNYNVTFNADGMSGQSDLFGGLFGSKGTKSVFENIYISGNIAVTGSVSGHAGRLGLFGAANHSWYGYVDATFNNCVFVGSATTTRGSAPAPFAEVLGNKDGITTDGGLTIANSNLQIKANNCYIINAAGNKVATGDSMGTVSMAMKNVYQTMASQRHHLNHGYVSGTQTPAIGYEGSDLWYLDCFNVGDIENGKSIETAWKGPDRGYSLEQFQGTEAKNAMIFNNPSEWIWFEDGTPVPAVFGDNAAALSVKSMDGIEKTQNTTSLLGAQLRVDKAGIRFIAEFDTSITSNYYTIEYGVLVLPKVAFDAGRELNFKDPVALRIATTDTTQLHAYDSAIATKNALDMTVGYSAIFSVLTNMPDYALNSDQDFQVLPYIAFLSPEDVAHNATVTLPDQQRKVSAIVYADNPQAFSGLKLANAACADATITTPNKIAICERFASVDGFKYEVVDGKVVAKA